MVSWGLMTDSDSRDHLVRRCPAGWVGVVVSESTRMARVPRVDFARLRQVISFVTDCLSLRHDLLALPSS